jgi:TonB family protein
VVVVTAARQPAPRVPWELLYIAGALLVAGRFGVGIWRTLKMVRDAGEANHATELVERLRLALRIGRPVRALESADAVVPMTWGILRPVALLPDGAREWPAARLHTSILHELVHVQRHDLLAQSVAQAVCYLYWFHPLAWLAARQLRKERERACDDAVLNRGVAPAEYAGHLMEMVRSMAARRASLADAPAMAEASDLESRVRALLDAGRNRAPLTRRAAMAVAALACALVLPVATLTTHAQAGRGALAGIITDPSGARIPKATVVAKNLDGSNQETTVANEAGEYGFAAIPPGRYAIEVRVPGFKLGKHEAVVTAGTAARVDAPMAIGSVSEAVMVRASRTTPAPVTPRAGTTQRIPVGGNVQQARLIRQPKPEYPADLKQQGVTGVVTIQAIISRNGELLNPQVINTNVDPRLAQAALDAVKQWRYTPTLLNGQPVEVTTTVDLTYELDQ